MSLWSNLIVIVPNAIGFVGMIVAGKKHRFGWTLGVWSEAAWAVWAILFHVWALLPFCVAWTIVYGHNRLKWGKHEPNV